MKKIQIIMASLFAIAVLFTACGDDDIDDGCVVCTAQAFEFEQEFCSESEDEIKSYIESINAEFDGQAKCR